MVAIVDKAVVTLHLVVVGSEIEQILILFAHIERRGGVLQMLLDGSRRMLLDAVDTIGKLRLDGEHLDGTEILLDHLAAAVEEAYLLTNEAGNDQSRLDSSKHTGLNQQCAILHYGGLEHLPFGSCHPGDDRGRLLRLAAVVDFLELLQEEVVGIAAVGIERCSGNHTVDHEGVVALLGGFKDEVRIFGIEFAEGGKLQILLQPDSVALLGSEVGILHLLKLGDRHKVAVVVVDRSLVVGKSKLENAPRRYDAETGNGKEVDDDVEDASAQRDFESTFCLGILHFNYLYQHKPAGNI